MSGWTWQAWVGLVGGTLIFFAVLGPVLLFQLRRYGQISFLRMVGAAAVSICAVALVAYTLLPLPAVRENCGLSGSGFELVPRHSISDIARDTTGLSVAGTLTSPAMLQVVMNVILFIPLGLIARRYWGRGLLASILLGALVSVAIEATQFNGIWGLYACSYRVADVDDLIANTSGAAIGALLAPVFLGRMPTAQTLRASRHQPRPVTVWRRWFGMVLDAAAVQITLTVSAVPFLIWEIMYVAGGTLPPPEAFMRSMITCLATILLLVVAPALHQTGASVGQRLVFLAPSRSGGGMSRVRLVCRGAVVGVPYIAANIMGAMSTSLPSPVSAILGVFVFVLVACAVVSIIPTRAHRGLSYALVGLDIRDARSRHPEGEHWGRQQQSSESWPPASLSSACSE